MRLGHPTRIYMQRKAGISKQRRGPPDQGDGNVLAIPSSFSLERNGGGLQAAPLPLSWWAIVQPAGV